MSKCVQSRLEEQRIASSVRSTAASIKSNSEPGMAKLSKYRVAGLS